MGQVLAQLIAAGLITRRKSLSHGRILETTLTTRGRRLLNACDRDIDQFEKTMLGALSTDERRQMMHGLLSCVRALHGGLNDIAEVEL
jgi:DNA-binding MarR family transcriptional regulator